jgi:ketosteroid isomerase-like protein
VDTPNTFRGQRAAGKTGSRTTQEDFMQDQTLIARAKSFVAAVAAGKPREVIESFYTEDVTQEVNPSLVAPEGTTRDFIHMRAAYDRSRRIIRAQTYDVISAFASGNTVVIEVIWTATLEVGMGRLKPGDTMRARYAQFFEFRADKICRIRNYDCFDPF